MKNTQGGEVYKKFNNPGILEDFIKLNGPKGSVYSVSVNTSRTSAPNNNLPRKDMYDTVIPKTIPTNGTVGKPKPYVVPATIIKTPDGKAPASNQGVSNVTHVRLAMAKAPVDKQTPTSGFSSVYDPSSEIEKKPNSILKSRPASTPNEGKPNTAPVLSNNQAPKNFAEGAVIIHVDNLNNPNVSKSPSATPGTKSPETSSSSRQRGQSPVSSRQGSSRRSVSPSSDSGGSTGRRSSDPIIRL